MFLGAQKNRLVEAVHLWVPTSYVLVGNEKIMFHYALLSGGLPFGKMKNVQVICLLKSTTACQSI